MISSPCIGLCRIDDATALCLGCARTRDEIALWREVSPESRRKIWAGLPARREKIGLALHRLDWDAPAIAAYIRSTLRPGFVWTAGIAGACAEFRIGGDEPVDVQESGGALRVLTSRGGLGFRLGEQVRAFCFGATPDDGAVVLAVHRSKAPPFEGARPFSLGPDREALREQDRAMALFDLGLGLRTAGIGFRAADRQAAARLEAAFGPGGDGDPGAAAQVVRHAIGRMEVFAGARPEGHFSPTRLAGAADALPGIALPEGFVGCAVCRPPDL
jgi:predicted Fe-S protein YdhL (DUF1289 family)